MKYWHSLCLLTAFPFILLNAQEITLKGNVRDNHGQPGAATVGLSPVDLDTPETQIKTGNNGLFLLKLSHPGTYVITVEAIGYHMFTDTLNITAQPEQRIPTVILQERNELLDEVIVTGKKPLIRQSGNTLTVDLSERAAVAGVSVSDVLRRLPDIGTGQDGQLSLMGSSRIAVVIDGKPSYLPPTQLSNLLSGMSAATIEKIEITNSASASEDAGGGAGIIRITTKRSSAEGFGLSAVSGIGRSYKNTFSTNTFSGNYRLGNANLYGMVDLSSKHRYFRSQAESAIQYNGEDLRYLRISDRPIKTVFYTYQLGADWEITRRHQLDVAFDGYLDDWRMASQSHAAMVSPAGTTKYHAHSDIRAKEPYYYNSAHIGYTHRMDSAGSAISAVAEYISFRNNSDGAMDSRISEAGSGDVLETGAFAYRQPLFIDIFSGKVDAAFPAGVLTLKTGVKYAQSNSDNPITYRPTDGASGTADDNQTGRYRYREGISAAYISTAMKLARASFTFGLRGEHTSATQQDVNNRDRWDYFSLFPSLSATVPLAEDHTVTLDLSRRINRPSYTDLSPTRWFYDANYYTSGTPGLQPEFSWNAALTYALKEKYNFHISYAHRTDAIAYELVQEDGGLIISRYANYPYARRWETGFMVPFAFGERHRISLSANGAFMEMPVPMAPGEADAVARLSGNCSLMHQGELPWGVTLETSIRYQTGELSGIYRMLPSFSLDGGLKKSFLENSLTANASFSDLFFTDRYRSVSVSPMVDYQLDSRMDSRRFFLTLTYNLGTLFKKNNEQSDEKERL